VLLRKEADVETVGECGSGVEAIAEIRKSLPNLVFLDVARCRSATALTSLEMPGPGDALGCSVCPPPTTHYALRAFEAGALDYLLKPFDNARFERALGRARDKIAHSRNQDF